MGPFSVIGATGKDDNIEDKRGQLRHFNIADVKPFQDDDDFLKEEEFGTLNFPQSEPLTEVKLTIVLLQTKVLLVPIRYLEQNCHH